MTIYCYSRRTPEGEYLEGPIERVFPMGKAPASITVRNDRWYRDVEAEHRPSSHLTQGAGAWPLKSDAAGLHPSQIPEMEEYMRAQGAPTRWDRETGQAIFESRSHRARALKVMGMHDQDGGYGDG